ncbi:MAG: tetratricopeptide repeat protein [bacterium]
MEKFPLPEHLDGNFEKAEKKYLEFQIEYPENIDLSFWLGYLYFQKGEYDKARKNVIYYLQISPANSKAWNLLGLIYKNLGEYNLSNKSFLKAIEVSPVYYDAKFNLAVNYVFLKEFDAAIEILNELIQINDNDYEPLFYLGYCYHQLNNYNLAIHFYNNSLQLNDTNKDTYVNLSIVYISIGKFDDALQTLNDGLEVFPEDTDIFITLAFYYQKTGNMVSAIEIYQNLIIKEPDNYLPYYNIANIYKNQWNLDLAEINYLEALQLKTNDPDILLNLGTVFHAQTKFKEAILCFDQILKTNNQNIDALNNLGGTYFEMGDYKLAIDTYKKAILINPQSPLEHFNLGMTLLLTGDIKNGFKEYEWRTKLAEFLRTFNKPKWNGENLNGKKIFIYGEQGIGDIFQFIRFLPIIKDYGAYIIFECRNETYNLVNFLPYIDKLIIRGSEILDWEFDYYSSLLSLPSILGITESTIPNTTPYLFADDQLVIKWKKYFSDFKKLKIGFVWKGNPFPPEHRKRHTKLEYFINLAKNVDAQFFSLQYGEDCENELNNAGIIDLPLNLDETAAIIANLDLVITIDTSIAHLAGALGKKVWILLAKIPDWRWMLLSDTSIWYPNARLFRQTELNEWDDVFNKIKENLNTLTQPNIPQNMDANIIKLLKERAYNYLETNDLDNAIKEYENLLEFDAADIENNLWLGTAYFMKNDFFSAAKFLSSAINFFPALPEEIYQNLSACFLNLKDFENAFDILKRAIEIYPNSFVLLNNMGLYFVEKKEYYKAEQFFIKSIQNNQTFISAWVNLVNMFVENKNYKLALEFGKKAIELTENNGLLLRLIADSYMFLQDNENAEIYYKKALVCFEDEKTYNNYAILLQKQHKINIAEEYLKKALKINPINAGYWGNLGNNYSLIHDFENSIICYNKAIELNNTNTDITSRIGMINLLTENFDIGWQKFELSLTKKTIFDNLNIGKPFAGQNLSGKTILIYSEHGFGDIIQFSRYIPLIKDLGCNIIFEFPIELKSLFFYTNHFYQPIVRGEVNYKSLIFDYYISLLSLPKYFCTNIANVPKVAPIFNINRQTVDLWKEKIKTNKKKIGIVWAGNPNHPNDHNRSIPLDFMQILFNISDTQFYLLQKNFGLKQKTEIIGNFKNIIDLENDLNDIETTVAVLLNMDIIITVDTMIAHLAASLNIKTLLLLPYLPDWRWLLNRSDSIWYNSMQIFRQPNPGDWITTIENVFNYVNFYILNPANLHKIKQLTDSSNYGEAIDLIKTVLEDPKQEKSVLLEELGKILLHTKDYSGAIEVFNSVINLSNANYNVLYNIGYCYHLLNNLDKAKEYYNRSLIINPFHINTLNNMGLILRDEGNYAKAKEIFEKAIRLNYYKAFLHNNLGTVLEAFGDLFSAKEEFLASVNLSPNYAEGYMNLSNALHYLGSFDEGLFFINKALEINPNYADAHFNKSLLLLRKGNLKDGFKEYEWRILRKDYPLWEFSKPLLVNLNDAIGKRVLIYDEQGYGDTLQFSRYIQKLKKYNCYIIMQCHTALVELMQCCKGVDEVIGRTSLTDPNIDYDLRIPLLNLGTFFETSLEEIEVNVPYILIDKNSTDEWKNKMESYKKLQVGFVWSGKQTPGNTQRSCNLNDFLILFNNTDISFFSLQIDELANNNDQVLTKYGVNNIGKKIKTFKDTASIISNLDLVISIDTSVAHLAGALGIETWLLLSTKCDWRWHDNRTDNPWYPTMVLFRQKEYNNWNTVFDEVNNKLKEKINK